MPNPYHVRLAISQYGDRFRAEVFTEDLGDTDGELLPADWRDSFERWLDYLQGGGKPAPESDADIGGQLFDWLFGSVANRAKWTDVLGRAGRDGNRPVRLLIDSSTLAGPAANPDADRIHNLPYGLLFDRQRDTFVFRPQPGKPPVQYVRIVRRCTPRLLNLERAHWPLRVLLAVAEPEGLAFGGAPELARLAEALTADPEAMTVFVCAPDGPRRVGEVLPGPAEGWTTEGLNRLCRTTPEQLRSALAAQRYDLLHLVAHGSAAGLVLCAADGRRAEVRARELCEWCNAACSCTPACGGPCRLNPRVQMAFLQVCRAAGTHGQGSFGGLAQKLINPDGGDLAAVVASPYVLEAEESTAAALEFYSRLRRGEPPDQALVRNLPMADWAWAFLELWVRPSALTDTGTRGAFQFVSPYRGLSSFRERDADVFFGREEEVEAYRDVLATEPVLVVAGDSGSGKSSVLYAGLAHRVRCDGLAGRGGWRIVAVRPGREPARNLMAALLLHKEPGRLELPTPGDWGQALMALLATSCSAAEPLLLIVDQFEELFTLCADAGQREAVAKALAEMTERAQGHFRLVVATRNDYLGAAVTLPGLGIWLQRPRILRPPTAEAVRAIVARPAETSGYRFEGPLSDTDERHRQGLLERILADPLLRGEKATEEKAAAPLPLLEFALEQLWLRAVERGSLEFTHADYDRLGGGEGEQQGGLGGAIAQHAGEVYRRLPEMFPGLGQEAQKLAEELFTSLVSSTHRTRTPCRRKEIEERSGRAEAMRGVIDHLVGERLLTIRSDPNDLKETQVDLAHEVLIKRWGQLRKWLDHDRGEQVRKEEFRRDAARWDRGSDTTPARSRSGLPGTDTQIEYVNWVDKRHSPLTEAELAFVRAMKASLRQRKLLWRFALIASLAVAAAMVVLAVLAVSQATRARNAQETAEERLAETRLQYGRRAIMSDGDPIAGLLWLAEAVQTRGAPAKGARHSARTLIGGWARSLPRCTLPHQDPVDLSKWSPDGKTVVTASGKEVRLWDAATGEARGGPLVHEGQISAVSFSPDGAVFATSCFNPFTHEGGAYLWDTSTGRKRVTLTKERSSEVYTLAMSPDGKMLATGTTAGTMRYDTGTGQPIGDILKQNDEVVRVQFSPDGKTLATASYGLRGDDGSMCIWDALTGARLFAEPLEEDRAVTGMAFSKKGIIATALANGEIYLRDAISGKTQGAPLKCNTSVIAVAFTPDGKTLASGCDDGTVQLWDLKKRDIRGKPLQHSGSVRHVEFSPDGATLATTSDDGTARLWDSTSGLMTRLPLRHGGAVRYASFSPGGGSLATASADGSARVWDIAINGPGRNVLTHTDTVGILSYSPDGTTIAASCRRGATVLWDTKTLKPKETQIKDKNRDTVIAAAFTAGGGRLLTATPHGVRRWDLSTGALSDELKFGSGLFDHISLQPDLGLVAAAEQDVPQGGFEPPTGNIYVWALGKKEPRNNLRRLPTVSSISLSPDGKLIASAWDDNSVRLSEVESGGQHGGPLRHPRSVNVVAFSPDGRALATASGRELRLWDVATATPSGERMLRDDLAAYITFSPDGGVLGAGDQRKVQLWDVESRTLRGEAIQHPLGVSAIAFDPSAAVLAIASGNQVWFAEIPSAATNDGDRISLSVQVRTASVIEKGVVRMLSEDELADRRTRLAEIGGDCFSQGMPPGK